MLFHCALRAVVLGSIGMMMVLSPALGRTLKIGGTGAVTALLSQLAPAFKEDTGITLDVISGLGSSGANNAVVDGKLGLAFAGRELKDGEKAKGLKVVTTFRTPFGLVTSRTGPDSLKSADLAALYRSDRPVWADGMLLLITLRPVDESDNLVLGQLFPGMTEALQHLRKRRDLSIAATDQYNADIAERVKGSLTTASLTQIMAETRNLRFVAVDGVTASLENYLNGSYPYGKSLYLVAPSIVSPEAESFIAFLAKPSGEALLRKAALVSGK